MPEPQVVSTLRRRVLDTRELAVRVIRAKGLDEADRVLPQSVTFRIVQALSIAAKRGRFASEGKRKGARVWNSIRPCPTNL